MIFGKIATNDNPFEQVPIQGILPQQPPFLMADALLHFDREDTITRYTVPADGIFVDNGELNPCALAEIIAQCAAARIGYYNKYILHRPVQIGFIGSIKNMRINRAPKVGETLTAGIHVKQDVMGLTLVDAEVRSEQETIATAEMKIAIAEQ